MQDDSSTIVIIESSCKITVQRVSYNKETKWVIILENQCAFHKKYKIWLSKPLVYSYIEEILWETLSDAIDFAKKEIEIIQENTWQNYNNTILSDRIRNFPFKLKEDKMSLGERLKEAQTAALRNKDAATRSLIGSVLSDAKNVVLKEKVAREVTDADIMAAIRRFIKSAKETQTILVNAGRDTSATVTEIELLESFLPKQMSEDEIRASAEAIIVEQNLERSVKSMGKIIKELLARHEGQFDNATASGVVKTLIS